MHYKVRQGDSMSSLARKHGFCWETIWNHPENDQLKQQRGNPDILYPGDRVFIPALIQKEETIETGQRHRFVAKGRISTLKLILEYNDVVLADTRCCFAVDGHWLEANTDSNGLLEARVSNRANNIHLLVFPNIDNIPTEIHWEISVGHLDPKDEIITGVQQRLANLGYCEYKCEHKYERKCEPKYDRKIDGQLGTPLPSAIRTFQAVNSLETSGEIDSATLDKLVALHGC